MMDDQGRSTAEALVQSASKEIEKMLWENTRIGHRVQRSSEIAGLKPKDFMVHQEDGWNSHWGHIVGQKE